MSYTTTTGYWQPVKPVVMRKKKMKKQDRFERMVRKWFAKIPQGKLVAIEPEVAKLLRREHAWMRKTVRQLQRDCPTVKEELLLDHLLERLEQRQK